MVVQRFLARMVHVKCRSRFYPRTNEKVERTLVQDEFVQWSVPWPEYKPTIYTAPFIHGQPWADPEVDDLCFRPLWNALDGEVNRASFVGVYEVSDKKPLNPMGRTGLSGRGCLGRWGPNHAADPIVTRWKRSMNEVCLHPESGKRILQFVAIQRRDSGEWAIPGGMVDPGEVVTSTLKREFLEEALNSLEKSESDLDKPKTIIDNFFNDGIVIYKGYVDDPRNTDNAWMETVAMHFHDDSGLSVGSLKLNAGDDAANVCWMDIDRKMRLYASHNDFFAEIAKRLDIHW